MTRGGGNLRWREGRPYWLDWEEASRAPAVADLATWLYGTPFVPPTPTPDADLAAYEEVYGPVDRVALDAAFLLLFLTLDVPVLGEMLSRLLEAHEIILADAHDAAARIAEQGDDGSNDLLVSGVIRTNELPTWFIAEHQVETPLVQCV